ncbi:MAG: arginine--tRNA ligase [Nanoarchaeota archaeon]|nr:arginine--tRNA ligase [Nanoarchaeota archaeon]
MKEVILKLIEKELKGKLKKEEIEKLIEIPPSDKMGDYSFPCFSLAKIEKKSPLLIAEELKEKIQLPIEISNTDAKAGYLNFFVNKKMLAKKILEKIIKENKNFGKTNIGKNKTIVIDMSSPNIAKPFGIGHLRSTIIGNSIANICMYNGFKVIKINYLGDWGTQFGKLIVGYKKFGNASQLKKDPIKHLYEVYVKANKESQSQQAERDSLSLQMGTNKNNHNKLQSIKPICSNKEDYEQEARDWFKKLENGDKEALKFWKTFKELSLKEFEKIYKLLNIQFNVISGESFYNTKMENTIQELKKKNLLIESQGAFVVDLEKYNLGYCLIQKTDGATLYATRDITAAIDRHNKFKFEKMIYEVGSEQKLHFNQVFKVLELMGYKWAENLIHVEHGLYLGEDNKKLATRKGKTIFMQDILDETIQLAKKELESRYKLSKKELESRSLSIARAAIFYGDLKNYRANDMVFDIENFISFNGNTGPYLQYSYARANSILKKVKKSTAKYELFDLKEQEIKLIKKLNDFPETIFKAYEKLSPSEISNYSYELSQIFNEFYQECPVIGSIEQNFRLKLVEAFRDVMKNSLNLLGIDAIEEM